MIGSWRVARLLGAGGMGRVYLAVQPAIGARVAIKVLKREAALDSDLVERFFNEARAVNLIRHEAIVDVFDLGRLPDGSPYIVMEHLDGASLGALFRRHKPFPLGTLARLLAEVLAALGAAHGKTIIHRDLKPDNVFISPAGRVTVLDFGIAKLASLDTTTQTGSVLGTPAYMAPEQARSQPVDARADLYAAGVILYQGATGAPPFAAASLYELLDLQVKAQPASPRAKNPEIPEALETVILRALAKDPADRFPSAAAMREALLASVADLPTEAFAEVSIAQPPAAGPPSDPFASTAATQSSLAHGETMPSEQGPPAKPATPAGHIQISRTTAFALGGVALLGLGAAAFMALRDPERATTLPPIDARIDTISLADPIDAGAIDATVPAPVPAVFDAPPADAPQAPRDAAPRPPRLDAPKPATTPTAADLMNGPQMFAIENPKKLDAHTFYLVARNAAERVGGRVFPTQIFYRQFDRNGLIDTTTGDGLVEVTFFSVDNAKLPEKYCYIIVSAQKGAGRIVFASPTDGACDRPRGVRPPVCRPADLWRLAETAKPDAGSPPLEELVLASANRVYKGWQLTATAPDNKKFSAYVEEACP